MNVLIGVDDSPESRHAVQTAYAFFGDRADYTIVSVGHSAPLFAATYPTGTFAGSAELVSLFDSAERTAQQRAVEAAKLIPAPDVEAEGHMGHIGRSLCEAAEEHGSQVVVIGSHDKNVWQRLFDPSVGRYLIDHAPCAVLVVR